MRGQRAEIGARDMGNDAKGHRIGGPLCGKSSLSGHSRIEKYHVRVYKIWRVVFVDVVLGRSLPIPSVLISQSVSYVLVYHSAQPLVPGTFGYVRPKSAQNRFRL